MLLTTQTEASDPTGGPYWRTVIQQTIAEVLDREPSSSILVGSYAHATVAEALRDVDILVLLRADQPVATHGHAPIVYRSSLPLSPPDVVWTRLAAGTTALYAPTTVDAPVAEPPRQPAPPPRSYRAFKELADWLDADDEEIAHAVGIGRTTPYAWRRDGHEPRPATVRKLYETHTVLDALRRQLGHEQLSAWLCLGSPSRRSVLLAGELDALARAVDDVLFGQMQTPDLAWTPETSDDDDTAASQTAENFDARPSGRRRQTKSV